MPQCSVCAHADRATVDKTLVAGASLRDVAGRFGLTKSSVERHQADHLPARLVRAQEKADVREAIAIVEQLKLVNAAALHVLKQAKDSRDGELMLKAADRILKQIELQAKLLGELDERPVLNVLVAPEWLELRVVILNALRGHPDAQRDVIEAISGHAS
jgi:transposase